MTGFRKYLSIQKQTETELLTGGMEEINEANR